jgi:Domain of unknown function (DUF4348)
MKRVLILIIAIILSFTLGYWTSRAVDTAEALAHDNVKDYALRVDTVTHEKNELFTLRPDTLTNLGDRKPENFDDFIYRFNQDSLFQLSRVKFPIGSVERSEWKTETLFVRGNYRPQVYDNFKGELEDTDERLLRKLGLGNGIWVEYRFSRINGLWYLISLTDFSD